MPTSVLWLANLTAVTDVELHGTYFCQLSPAFDSTSPPAILVPSVGLILVSREKGRAMFKARNDGFTLIELMIVIAIIAILAAIAIPNLKDARKAANEASAIAILRSIHSAQNIYREQDLDGNGTLEYCDHIATLIPTGALPGVGDAPSVDANVRYKNGYSFNIWDGSDYCALFKFAAQASPEEGTVGPGQIVLAESGDRLFFVNQTGVIRYCVNYTGATTIWPAVGK